MYHRQRPLPVPAFWPGGHDHFEPAAFDGDLTTRLLAIDLYTDGAPEGTPSMATLIRRPPDAPAFEPGWAADPRAFVHHWEGGAWRWTLALWGRPLSLAEFDRVVGSMPES
ncbi:hypothetical protein [Streptomyces sp. 4F14]|uniref:hypothetical protein n=1 Tax=Streptomyces sp. 4F14 TaxID=3394380 RepID=UPI003A878328